MASPRGKYATILDPETWAYIDEVDRWFPPELADRPIEEQRRVYDDMCRYFHTGRPTDVSVAEVVLRLPDRNIRLRRYSSPGAADDLATLYFHGGGFVFGDLDSHDDFCADICSAAQTIVVSVDYRLAPEHLHPAAFDDALAAFDWLVAQGTQIVLTGESAGGGLAAAIAHARRGLPLLKGMLLIYPVLGTPTKTGSYLEHAEAPLLSTKAIVSYAEIRAGGRTPLADLTFHPLEDRNFSGLPPTVVVAAQCDPLADDGRRYAERIAAAGGQALCREEMRLTHSFLRSRITVPRAREAFDAIIDDVVNFKLGSIAD